MPFTASDLDDGESLPNFAAVLASVAGRARVDPELASRIRAVHAYLQERAEADADAPFLTVLVRTQGRRIEPLKDALLCLQGQTDQDFEIVLLVHDADEDAQAEIIRIVERQIPSLRERIRVEIVEGGSRARPLNVGLDDARGRYVAVFDDDDLLFAHWVEAFRDGARLAPGKMVRSVVANQEVVPEPWSGERAGFRATSWPKAEYPDTFDQLEHLLVNYSPFMSWAFPRELFSVYGVRFDEELAVCEDWDVILRGSLLVGVRDVQELTALYRRWKGGSSSYSVHSGAEWKASEERVILRIDDSVLLLPPGSMQEVRRLVGYAQVHHHYRFLFRGNQLRFPLNVGWRIASPGVRIAVRVRDRIRRMRAR